MGFWLPFVVGAPDTVHALGHFRIANVPESALRALGVHTRATPSWDRMAQVGAGGAAALWCVATRRWPAALMVAAAVRIAIDPSAHPYYTASLVAFVVAWELISTPWAIPVVSIVTGVALVGPRYIHWNLADAGAYRLAACVAVVVLGAFVRGPGRVGESLLPRRQRAAAVP